MSTEEAKTPRQLEPITYSALSTFRNCRKMYWWRYVRQLAPKYRDPVLWLGALWHEITELYDHDSPLTAIEDHLKAKLPARHTDPEQRKFWHLLRAMFAAYTHKYSGDDAKVIATEKKFVHPIINPATGAASRSFVMAGKVDAIIERKDRRYIRERKTAGSIDQGYLERLWTDFQSQLYAYFIEQAEGVKIHGVEYDIAVKVQLKQREGETVEEFEARRAELAAKNKSGKSSAVQQIAESDEDFAKRLAEKYTDASLMHREELLFSVDELNDLRAELWELTQAILEARRRDAWYKNTSQCFAYGKPCAYYQLCRSNGNPILIENHYEHRTAHEELNDDSSAVEQPAF